MDIEEKKAAIEAILFAAGREVKVTEIMSSLEIGEEEAITILNSLASDFNEKKSGLKINNQLFFDNFFIIPSFTSLKFSGKKTLTAIRYKVTKDIPSNMSFVKLLK